MVDCVFYFSAICDGQLSVTVTKREFGRAHQLVPVSFAIFQGGGFSNFSLRRHPIKCWMATLLPVLSYFSISDGNLYLPSIQVPIFFYIKKKKKRDETFKRFRF
jgi:hypothetical protein